MMDKMPIEIQDKIFQYYWGYEYVKITKEIKSIFKLNNKIISFMKKYKYSINETNNIFYYRLFNDELKKMNKNKGLLLISKINKLPIYHSTIEISKKIKDKYKYIAPILISFSGYQRFYALERISNYP